jgi:solute carrier family 13 (sodium-dependent dicarboxylate transporter), member 2/3/5
VNSPKHNWSAFFAGPAVFAAMLSIGTTMDGPWKMVVLGSLMSWMAVWWLTEAVPLSVTSLLPLVIYPLTGVMGTQEVAPVYMKDEIFLFIGGFMVAYAMEAWGLHRRIAVSIILRVGYSTARILLGFMIATWFLSMWMSNTAATLVMLPTALGLLANFKAVMPAAEHKKFASGLLTGIAFAASLGGIATLVGTVPNMIFAGMVDKLPAGTGRVTFAQWFLYGFPLSVMMLGICYLILRAFHASAKQGGFAMRRAVVMSIRGLGPMKFEEKVIAILMVIMVFLWVFMKPVDLGLFTIPGWSELFSNPGLFRDSTVAIAIALALFMIPSRTHKGETILTWTHAKQLPFDILLLFGGGFALAKGFEDPIVTSWLQLHMQGLSQLSPFVVLIIVCFGITFFSELTSNVTATQLSLPILAILAPVLGVHPYYLMVPATISASFGFMLPVATPPNTIVYGTGQVNSRDMKRAGLALDFIGPVLLILVMYLYGYAVIGI